VWWYRLGGGKLDDVEIDDPDDSEADDWDAYERYALCVSVTILVTELLSIGAECERSSGAWALNIAVSKLVQYLILRVSYIRVLMFIFLVSTLSSSTEMDWLKRDTGRLLSSFSIAIGFS